MRMKTEMKTENENRGKKKRTKEKRKEDRNCKNRTEIAKSIQVLNVTNITEFQVPSSIANAKI